MPRSAIPSLKLSLRTAQEYGFSAARQSLRLSFGEGAEMPVPQRYFDGAARKCRLFAVDKAISRSLYTGHRRAVRLQRDCAPLKLLTGPVNGIRLFSDAMGFDGSPANWGVEIATISGLFEK